MKRNILVSFSGGRTSAYMAKSIKESPDYADDNLIFVYANTGKEFEETLEFVHQCDKEFRLGVVWLEAKINPGRGEATTYELTDFYRASRKGEPFIAMMGKYSIPNQSFPHCTRELKIHPIHAYAKVHFRAPYVTAMGMRWDEMRRVKYHDPAFIYPLVDQEVTLGTIREFWNKMPFDLRLKDYEGNCDFCWKKSVRKKLTLLKERPEIAQWWRDQEDRFSTLQIATRKKLLEPSYFGRKNVSIAELEALSKQPFVPVTDRNFKDELSDEMDFEQPCLCAHASEGDEE